MPDPESVPGKIEQYLATMPGSGVHKEVGFFGGTFTGLSLQEQRHFLEPVRPFLEEERVQGLRLSTRPDLVDEKKARFLKTHGVTCVELGVQSMSDSVLARSKRGHTAEDVKNASWAILTEGLSLGHQMMVGLPDSSLEDELYTAKCIAHLGASQVRIYPVIVICETELAEEWRLEKYEPLPLEEALDRAALLIQFFESNDIKVIRCGLHPSEGLLSGEEYLAGPFDPRFGQRARERARSSEQ